MAKNTEKSIVKSAQKSKEKFVKFIRDFLEKI